MAEYDDLGQQLDALMQESSLLKAPGIFQEKQNPGSRAEYQLQREALAQRIADMKRKYEASIGNPGAVTGRTMAGMNSPPVPALRIDSPTGLPSAPTGFGVPPNLDTSAAVPGATALDGALPPVRRPVMRQPVGALQAVPQAAGVDANALGDTALAAPGATAIDPVAPVTAAPASPATPAAPATSLRDEFVKRIAGMDKTQKTGMSDEQKGQALMEAGLAIMAAASKPGASAMGAVGQGGMQGTAVAREMERINRAQADKLRAEDRANIGTEFTLAGQDRTSAETAAERKDRNAIRREEIARETGRDTQTADYQNRHLDVLREQFRAGSKKVVEDGKTGTYTILDVSGSSPPVQTGVKFDRKDDTPAEVKLLKALRDDPTLLATSKALKTETFDTKDKGKMMQIWAQGYTRALSNPLGDESAKYPPFDEFYRRANEGGGAPGGMSRFNTVAEAQAAKAAGKIKTGDTIMTPNGPIVVR